MVTLFLGGTTKSNWREKIILLLKKHNLPFFNPIVENWDSEARDKEYQIKSNKDTFELYVVDKNMGGVFSIAEAVDASNKKPDKVIFCILRDGINDEMLNSLEATSELIQKNGGYAVDSLYSCVRVYQKLFNSSKNENNRYSGKVKSNDVGHIQDVFLNLENIIHLSSKMFSFPMIFDRVGLSDILDTMYIDVTDLTKEQSDFFYKAIQDFIKLPIYSDLSLEDPKDLKFLKDDAEFKVFLKKKILELKKKLLSKEGLLLNFFKKFDNGSEISLEKLMSEVKLDRASVLLMLDDLKHRKKIYDYNGREVTLN